jgi:hypothetical protein
LHERECSFSEIWEKDGAWLTGREILHNILSFWQTQFPLQVVAVNSCMQLQFVFPKRYAYLQGQQPITKFVPENLVETFYERLKLVKECRQQIWQEKLYSYLYAPINNHTIQAIIHELVTIEYTAKMQQLPQLHEIAATLFGFSYINLEWIQ